jgi:hypothetical protein
MRRKLLRPGDITRGFLLGSAGMRNRAPDYGHSNHI